MATTCPHGLTNDPYPGSCGLYVDTNNDQICDLSQEISSTPQATAIPQNFSLNPAFIFIFLGLTLAYLVTSKQKLFWNIALILTFIPTAITSFAYIFGLNSPLLYQLHLYFGFIFILISLYHILWHLPYWQGIVKKVFK